MLKKLSDEEKAKLTDFMTIYRKYLNPDCDGEIDTIIDYVIDFLTKVYLEYKDIIPYISIADDEYNYYLLKPENDKYSLLDYLINTAIQNLDSVKLVNDAKSCNYNMLKKTIFINKNKLLPADAPIFDDMKMPVNKEKYVELFYKNALYHEIGHMFHYKINGLQPNTVYVPFDYMALVDFPPLKKRMSINAKKKEEERRREIAKKKALEKLQQRISMYSVLGDKYNLLTPEEISDCDVKTEFPVPKYEEIMIPPIFYRNPVDEAFTECDAQGYSGLFENEIFRIDENDGFNCFYIPIDENHIIMTYSPSIYSFSSSIGSALKEYISKLSYFRTVFLGKPDLFIEFLGEYSKEPVKQFSMSLFNADKNNLAEVQPLLDSIVEFAKSKNKPLDSLNIYFPLVNKDGNWVYYTDALDKTPPHVLKK